MSVDLTIYWLFSNKQLLFDSLNLRYHGMRPRDSPITTQTTSNTLEETTKVLRSTSRISMILREDGLDRLIVLFLMKYWDNEECNTHAHWLRQSHLCMRLFVLWSFLIRLRIRNTMEWNKSHLNPGFLQNHEYTGSTLEYFQRFFE